MKTTLNIDDALMREIKQEAARQGRTMSDLVDSAIRLFLAQTHGSFKMPPLPVYNSGGALVDVADRNALYDVLDGFDADKD